MDAAAASGAAPKPARGDADAGELDLVSAGPRCAVARPPPRAHGAVGAAVVTARRRRLAAGRAVAAAGRGRARGDAVRGPAVHAGVLEGRNAKA